MSDSALPPPAEAASTDLGEYCRRVEEHLARANAGHLVRIAGTGFEVVRGWARAGIPLSVACRGIDAKAARHNAGRAVRPLRVEFCDDDVRALFEDWRRAVGTFGAAGPAAETPRRGSLPRLVEQAVNGLTRTAGRLEYPDAVREVATAWVTALADLQQRSRGARGAARDQLMATLEDWDRQLLHDVRRAMPPDELARLRADAEGDLLAYRDRLSPDGWSRAVEVNLDRLVRDRFGLPTLSA